MLLNGQVQLSSDKPFVTGLKPLNLIGNRAGKNHGPNISN